MMFPPMSLTTELSQASDNFFLGAGDDYLIGSRDPAKRPRPGLLPESAHRGVHYVLAWVVRSGRGRRRAQWVADFTSLSSVAVMFGLDADRAARLPDIAWSLFGPKLHAGSLTPARIAEAIPAPSSRREVARASAAEVREIYGRMLSDVAYRIENSALFDSEVPTTRRFEEALALWAEVTDATPEDETIRRAGMVRITFDAARAHAETVGLAHLPAKAREDAGRAAKAARLARSSTNAHEREAALEQVIRILSQLSLHFLPNPADATRQLSRSR